MNRFLKRKPFDSEINTSGKKTLFRSCSLLLPLNHEMLMDSRLWFTANVSHFSSRVILLKSFAGKASICTMNLAQSISIVSTMWLTLGTAIHMLPKQLSSKCLWFTLILDICMTIWYSMPNALQVTFQSPSLFAISSTLGEFVVLWYELFFSRTA